MRLCEHEQMMESHVVAIQYTNTSCCDDLVLLQIFRCDLVALNRISQRSKGEEWQLRTILSFQVDATLTSDSKDLRLLQRWPVRPL